MKASLLARAAPALLLAGVLTGGLAAPGRAQTGSGSAPGNQGVQTQTPTRQEGRSDRSLVEHRIDELHARLHITHNQERQWHAFTRVMRDNARDMDRIYRTRAEQLPRMNALQDLESYAQLERDRSRDVERLVPAFSHLYAVLSPEQKHEADQMFRAYARRYEHKAQTSLG